MNKKILLLGGSKARVKAIEKAKELGYRTILCGYFNDCPGIKIADKFYLVSTTDKEAVLEVAKREAVSGIVAYGSDPAAPTAAFVAEKLKLPEVPYTTAKSFCEKHLFRKWLIKHRFNAPHSMEIHTEDELPIIQDSRFPLIVKPDDGSGSKGVSIAHNIAELRAATSNALLFSRNGVVVVEDYIEKCHPT